MKRLTIILPIIIILGFSVPNQLFSQEESSQAFHNLNDQLKLGYGIGDRYEDIPNGLSLYLTFESNPEWLFEPLGNLDWLTAGAIISYTDYDYDDGSKINAFSIGTKFTVLVDQALDPIFRLPKIIQPYLGIALGYEYLTTPELVASGLYGSQGYFQLLAGININLIDSFGLYFEAGSLQSDFQAGINFRIK